MFPLAQRIKSPLRSRLTQQGIVAGHRAAGTHSYYERDRWIIYIDPLVSKSHFVQIRSTVRPPTTNRSASLVEGHRSRSRILGKRHQSEAVSPDAVFAPGVRFPAGGAHAGYLPPRHSLFWAGGPESERADVGCLVCDPGSANASSPPAVSWRDSLLKYFGADPLIDSRGQLMHWVGQEWATTS